MNAALKIATVQTDRDDDREPVLLRFPNCSETPNRCPDHHAAHGILQFAHGIPNPVRSPNHDDGPQSVPAEVLAHAQQQAARWTDNTIPADRRQWIAAHCSVREFWETYCRPAALRRIAAGKLRQSSLNKTRQALNRWERITQPADWNHFEWPGLPLAAITSNYLTEFTERLAAATSPATARSTWGHLRTILKTAQRLGALDTMPQPEPVAVPATTTTIYTDHQLNTLFAALADEPHARELRAALVLAVNTGLRAVDLFSLTWSNFAATWDTPRPCLTVTARKTGKVQAIPLALVTVAHLATIRPPSLDRRLFPNLAAPLNSKDPERHRTARDRNRRLRKILAAHGMPHIKKPWQAARATCNERLEAIRPGAGQFVLGHALTLNSRSYRQPDTMVFEAIHAVPQPAAFHALD